MELDMIFAENLKRLMASKNLRCTDIANYLGCSKTIVSEWMHGKKLPRMNKVDALCVLLNCTRSDLLEDKTEESPTFAGDSRKDIFMKLVDALTPEEKNQIAEMMIELISSRK